MNKAYIHRELEKELLASSNEFPVVVLTGPRQTGKSTLLRKYFPKHEYFTFDDPLVRKAAEADPKLFLDRSKKMIIDEIQLLPEILPYIKISVDEDRSKNGRFLLTGSQIFPLMAGVSESLAGRAALYELLGLSTFEVTGADFDSHASCFKAIFHGSFPEVVVHGVDSRRFYSAYLQTYLEKDIRQISSVHDLRVFQNFLELLAARVGNLLNLNEIAKECGISFTSAKRWLSLLEVTRMIYLLRPYSRNVSKRVIKSPKIYFTDTGLLSFILRYPDPNTLSVGPHAGACFENFVVIEFLKRKFNQGLNYELYFYRDTNHNEIDIVLDEGNSLTLMEIKATNTPKPAQLDALKKRATLFKNAKSYLLSFTKNTDAISSDIKSIPWRMALKPLLATKP